MKGIDPKKDTVQFEGEGHTLLSSKAFNEEGVDPPPQKCADEKVSFWFLAGRRSILLLCFYIYGQMLASSERCCLYGLFVMDFF